MTTQPDTNSALSAARNPNSAAEQLQACLGVEVKADRLIASHANCGIDALRRLGTSSDSECRQAAIRHANFPPGDEMKALIQEFPGEFFKNPALDLFLLEDPSLLSGLEEILDAPNCPDSIINWYLNNGTLSAKQRICLNEIGSPQIREKVNTQFFEDDFKKQAHRLSTEHPDPVFREAFGNYTKKTRPCAYPKFMPQDRSNPAHRTHDMLGGFPYTSEEFPWPVSAEGHHMQPVVQINLKEAGTLLDEDVGSGLLQLWTAPLVGSDNPALQFYGGNFYNGDYSNFLMRIIAKEATSTPASDFYPETFNSMIELSPEQTENPLIDWKRMAPMRKSLEPEIKLPLEDLAPDNYSPPETGEVDWQHHEFIQIALDNFNTPDRPGQIYLGGFSSPSSIFNTDEYKHLRSEVWNEAAIFCLSKEGGIQISILIEPLNYLGVRSGFKVTPINNLSLYLWDNSPPY
jgi:hypothetical protein